ncbi:MAG TPA: hypothetical protein VGP85_13280 [Pyrinomonadaceae bacterium]|nr:hypothetical protein [Pyrinomonadaceae bacterium]
MPTTTILIYAQNDPFVPFEPLKHTELVTLTNQQAFHRNCSGCHDEIVKTSKELNPPTSRKCTA